MFSVLVIRLRSLRLLRVSGTLCGFVFFGNLRRREIFWKDVFLLVDSSRKFKIAEVRCIVMRLRMFLLLITFLKASHSFRNRLLVICKNAYLFATMIMTSVSSPFSCC